MFERLTVLTNHDSDGEVCIDLRGVSSMVRLSPITLTSVGGLPGVRCPARTKVVIGRDTYLVAETPAEIRALAEAQAELAPGDDSPEDDSEEEITES